MENDNEQEGMSTGKKVVAGAAVGIAVPAAVTVAKKLLGNGDDEGGDDQQGSSGSGSRSSGGASGGAGRAGVGGGERRLEPVGARERLGFKERLAFGLVAKRFELGVVKVEERVTFGLVANRVELALVRLEELPWVEVERQLACPQLLVQQSQRLVLGRPQPDQGAALQHREAAEHRRAVEHVQAAARARNRLQALVGGWPARRSRGPIRPFGRGYNAAR